MEPESYVLADDCGLKWWKEADEDWAVPYARLSGDRGGDGGGRSSEYEAERQVCCCCDAEYDGIRPSVGGGGGGGSGSVESSAAADTTACLSNAVAGLACGSALQGITGGGADKLAYVASGTCEFPWSPCVGVTFLGLGGTTGAIFLPLSGEYC